MSVCRDRHRRHPLETSLVVLYGVAGNVGTVLGSHCFWGGSESRRGRRYKKGSVLYVVGREEEEVTRRRLEEYNLFFIGFLFFGI